MSHGEAVPPIVRALESLARDLDALATAGVGIPAVERNMVRMRGTVRALGVQFLALGAPDEASERPGRAPASAPASRGE